MLKKIEMRQSFDKVLAVLTGEHGDVSLMVLEFLAKRSDKM